MKSPDGFPGIAATSLPHEAAERTLAIVEGIVSVTWDDLLERIAEDAWTLNAKREARLAVYRSLRTLRSGQADFRAGLRKSLSQAGDRTRVLPSLDVMVSQSDLRESLVVLAFHHHAERTMPDAGDLPLRVAAAFLDALGVLRLDREVRLACLRTLLCESLSSLWRSRSAADLHAPAPLAAEALVEAAPLVHVLFDHYDAATRSLGELKPAFARFRAFFAQRAAMEDEMLRNRASASRPLLDAVGRLACAAAAAEPKESLLQRAQWLLATLDRTRLRGDGGGTPKAPGPWLEASERHAWPGVKEVVTALLEHAHLPRLVDEFLRGPWAYVMASQLARHGTQSPEYLGSLRIAHRLKDAFDGWGPVLSNDAQRAQHAMGVLSDIAVEMKQGLECRGAESMHVAQLWRSISGLIAGRTDPAAPMQFPGAFADIEPGVAETEGACAGARPSLPLLRVGDALLWRRLGEPELRLKLCWRSLATGWHVFVNRAGVKMLEAPAVRVAAMLRDGILVRSRDE